MESPNRLARLADIVFIVACISLTGLAAYRFMPQSSAVRAAGALPELVGKTVVMPDVDFTRASSTVVVAVHSQCRFCTESTPFYKRLRQAQRDSRGRWALVFGGIEDSKTIATYLTAHDVADPRVAALPATLPIAGTPTLLIIDSTGKITRAVAGRLSADQEADILKAFGT